MPVKEILPKLSDVPTPEGRYGAFGGRYVPETLIGALNQLSETYNRVSGESRFWDELDEEAASSADMKKTGNWKSVKSLDMFWEMMAYRQECSSGRMTGFIWLVFDDGHVLSKTLPSS